MGTLIASNSFTNNYSALKCLVAASFSGKSLATKVNESSETNITFEPFEKEGQNSQEQGNKRTDMEILTDPLAISWLLCRTHSSAVFGFGDQLQGIKLSSGNFLFSQEMRRHTAKLKVSITRKLFHQLLHMIYVLSHLSVFLIRSFAIDYLLY